MSLFTVKEGYFMYLTLQNYCAYVVSLCYHCDCGTLRRDRVGRTIIDRNALLASLAKIPDLLGKGQIRSLHDRNFPQRRGTFGGTPKCFHRRDQDLN